MKVQSQLGELESEIRPLDAETADRLASLGAALSEGSEPGGWIGVSPLEIIDVDEVARRVTGVEEHSTDVAWMEVLRNILILFPILLTWFGLAYASFGYQTAIQIDPRLIEQPFLALWEQGFRGLLTGFWGAVGPYLHLSFIAAIDFALILVVIVLTFIIQRHASVERAHRETAARILRRRLHDALADASVTLAGRATVPALIDDLRRSATALRDEVKAERTRLAQLEGESQRFVNDIRAAARDLRQAADGIGQASGDLTSLMNRIEAASQTISTSVTRTDSATTRLTSAIDAQTQELRHEHETLEGFSGDLRTLSETTIRTIEATLPEVAQSLARAEAGIASQVDQLGTTVHSEMVQLRTAIQTDLNARRESDMVLSTMATRTGQLATAAESLLARRDGDSAALAEAAGQLRQLTADLRRSIDRQQQTGTEQTTVLKSIQSALERVARDGGR